MSSADLTHVPALVYAGPTVYKHVSKGKKDLYIPYHIASQCERDGRPFPPEHTWRYGVSADDRHLVFFYNSASKRSVWTLPAVDEDGTARELTKEETMRSEGRTLSAGMNAKSAAQAASSPTAQVASTAALVESAASPPAAAVATPAPVRPRATPATTTTTTGAPPPAPPANVSSQAAPASSVQDRLAAWRAKQQAATSGTDRGNTVTSAVAPAPGVLHASPPPSVVSAPVAPAVASAELPAASPPTVSEPPEPTAAVTPVTPVVAAAEVVRDATAAALSAEEEELRRVQLTLQQERVAALRAEALAAQQQWRAQQAQAYEEEERARLVERRRVLEQARLAKEAQLSEAQSVALAHEEARRAEADATQQVNRFLEAAATVKQAEAAAQEASTSFAVALAHQLQASSRATSTPAPALQSNAEAGATEPTPSASSNSLSPSPQAEKKRPRIRATVHYDPAFIYTGDLLHLGQLPHPSESTSRPTSLTVMPPPPQLTASEALLLDTVPDGTGTLTIGPSPTTSAAPACYYEGAWQQGVPHGRGRLSLPECAVEGPWAAGRLGDTSASAPPAQVQTRRLRGLMTARDGHMSGSAHVELDNGALFTGFLEQGRPTARGASLLLPNGDLIEWLTPTKETRHALAAMSPLSPTSTSSGHKRHPTASPVADGCGACRLRRANGDLYVGEVRNFVPDGIGHCVFTKDGHEYRGHFHNGWMEGHGTYSFANGDVYIGELRRGVFHGRGALLQKGAFLYEGSWQDGDMHGTGKLTFADTGDVWEGRFEHNQRAQGEYTHCQWRPPQRAETPSRFTRKAQSLI